MGSNIPREFQKLGDLAERLRLHRPAKASDLSVDSFQIKDQCIAAEERDQNSESDPNPVVNRSRRVRPERAAVLISLFEGENGEIRVILTKRSSTLSSHSGEVALPGGKMEESDASDIETALREAKEEIGLDPSIVDVVTVLEPFYTKSNINVVPVVGIIWDIKTFKAIPNVAEVEAIFDAPLGMFLKDENRREEEREWMGYKYLLHYFDHQADKNKYVIWALTAGILIQTASVVYERLPAFEERRPEFWSGGRY